MKLVLFVLVCFSYIQSGWTQSCPVTNNYFGTLNPNSRAGSQDGNSNTGYIMLGTATGYEIDCCGVATGWEIEASAGGTVYFQIWRPSGSSYELVGENAVTVAGAGAETITITAGNQISIRSGDRFGWYASGTNIIEHKSVGTGNPDNTIWVGMTRPSVGATEAWTDAAVTVESGRTYAIRLDVSGGNSPTFDNPAAGSTYSIINDAAVGYLLETLTWSDSDVGDTLTAVMDTTTSKFSFDSTTGQLTVASSLSGPTVTETLDFTVSDFCGNTGTLSIDVTIVNEPPVIHNLPSSGTLSEDTTAQTLLFTINATDSADTVTCAFDASVPNTYPFSVLLVNSDYSIYVDSNPGLDYATLNQYDLTVVCNDGYQNSNTETFYLYLVQNQPPVIHNLQGATTLSTSSAIGTNVFTVNTTDNEGDALTYTMTCNPSPCPFDIFASGQIQLNADISAYTTVGYDLEITVADAKNTVGPKILTVIIQDINDPVLITNLPLTSAYSVPENTALSSSVFTVSFSDQDTQTWTFSMSSTPATGLSYFSLDSTGLISTSGTILDYETLSAAGTTSFTFTVSVNDGTASDTDPLVIDVINVNEAPAFPQTTYSLSTPEAPAGTSIGTPAFGVTDPDSGDSYTYSMDCGADTAYFLMNTTSGEVTFQSNYDTDAGLATTVTCTVTVEDTGSLTDTATLYIYISDTNDNTPVFSPASYSFFISYYASVGTAVGTITATDDDTGSFGTLTYTIDQTALLDEYFTIDNTGQITVKKTPNGNSIGYSTSVTLNATATDGGGQSGIAPVTIVISDTTTTSTTTTTDRYKTFLDDGRNVAWLVACLVLLAITAVVITWLVYTCNGENSCRKFRRNFFNKKKKTWRPRHRRLLTPPTPRTPHPPHRKQKWLMTVRQPPPPKSEQVWRSSVPVL